MIVCLSVLCAGQAFAADNPDDPTAKTKPQASQKADAPPSEADAPQSLEQASESFRQMLQQAKKTGFVTRRSDTVGQDASASSASGPNGAAETSQNSVAEGNLSSAGLEAAAPEFSCTDAVVLDFIPYAAIATYEDLVLKKREFGGDLDVTEIETLAKTYISLGMGAEAQALLRPYDSPNFRLLSRAGALISNSRVAGETLRLLEISSCGKSADLWASVEDPTRLGYSAYLSGPQSLEKELAQYPPFLRTYLTVDLAISAAENGNLLLSNRLWDTLVFNNVALEHQLAGDHAQLYLTALRIQARDTDRALQIFQYLGERDGLYRAKALKALASFKYAEGGTLSADMETDLLAITRENSGAVTGREAAVALIKNRIAENMTIDAIRTTKKMLQPDDPEFVYIVDVIAESVEGLLNAETSTVKMLGLNSYLEDPEFFASSDRQAALQRAALLAALALDLPELGDVIYRPRAPVNVEDQAFLTYAKALGALKEGSAAAPMESDRRDEQANLLRREMVLAALRLGDFKTASQTIMMLPEDAAREDLQARLNWLQGAWAKAEKAQIKSADAQQPSGALSSSQINMAGFLTDPKINANRAKNLKSPLEVAAFVADLNTDLSTVQEYLDNG